MNDGLITDKLITPKDLAKIFNISGTSVYRLIDSRKIPIYKVGGSLRFNPTDINEYLKKVRINPID